MVVIRAAVVVDVQLVIVTQTVFSEVVVHDYVQVVVGAVEMII